jgi:hypothetical protein
MFENATVVDEKLNFSKYEMCFVSENSVLLDDLNRLILIQGCKISTENYDLLRNMIHEGKNDDFIKETINCLTASSLSYGLTESQSTHSTLPTDVFYYYVEKADMFKSLQGNSKLNNREIHNILFWPYNEKGLMKLNKDLSNNSIKTLSNYKFSKNKYIAALHLKDIFKFTFGTISTITIFVTLLVAISFGYQYTKAAYYEKFTPEKIELALVKENNFINSFGEHKNNPKNFYNSPSASVHDIIADYTKFEPIILYKKNNTTNDNQNFLAKLDDNLLEKGKKIYKDDIDSYLFEANNYEKLLEIKNKNITDQTSKVFEYTEKAIIQDFKITDDELKLFRDIK